MEGTGQEVEVHGPVVEEPAVGFPDRGVVSHDKSALSGDGIIEQVEPEDLVPHQVILEAPAPRGVVYRKRRRAGGSTKRARLRSTPLRTAPMSTGEAQRQ